MLGAALTACLCPHFLLRTAPPFPCSPSAPVFASFLMSALVSADILLIRFFLCLAYIWLLVNASLGVPRWPAMDSTGGISVDGITWWAFVMAFTNRGGVVAGSGGPAASGAGLELLPRAAGKEPSNHDAPHACGASCPTSSMLCLLLHGSS